MSSLATKYRPRRFDDVIGQERVTSVLRAMVLRNSVPPAMIFGGTRGSGKTTLARILPAALNCAAREADGEPCGDCPSCTDVWKTSSVSVLEIDAASHSGKEDANKLRDISLYAHEGEWRVIVLDEAHMLTKDASNALLKTLEEPPANTIFLLLTTETGEIIETIRSRSMTFEFRRISIEDITRRLRQVARLEHIAHDEDMLASIARIARGGMRDALMTLDQAQLVGATTGAQLEDKFGIRESAPEMMRACMAGDHADMATIAYEAVTRAGDASTLIRDLTELVRDILVIQSGGKPPCTAQQAPDRAALASATPAAALPKALRLLWQAAERARWEDDQITTAQVAAVSLAETLGARPRHLEPISSGRSVEQALSADEMQEMIRSASLG